MFVGMEDLQRFDVNRGHEPSLGGRDSVEPASKRRALAWGRDDIRARQSLALPAVRFMESSQAGFCSHWDHGPLACGLHSIDRPGVA